MLRGDMGGYVLVLVDGLKSAPPLYSNPLDYFEHNITLLLRDGVDQSFRVLIGQVILVVGGGQPAPLIVDLTNPPAPDQSRIESDVTR